MPPARRPSCSGPRRRRGSLPELGTATTGLWPAPTATGPVSARVVLPGSKSITNRALVLGALADEPLHVAGALRARDTELMAAALRSLGTGVGPLEPGHGADGWTVRPAPLTGPASVDCGLAGTVMRFVPPVAALAVGDVRLDGDDAARVRPMEAVLQALRTLGVRTSPADASALPVVVAGTGRVAGGEVTLDASGSSQFVSGLLLCAARYDAGVVVRHDGKPMPSLPHVDMTVAMLRARGVVVDDSEPDTWRVEPGPVAGGRVDVEPDLSNAAPFLAAALVTGGRVVVPGWPSSTTQAGDRLRELLELAGADVTLTADGLEVVGRGVVHGFDVDLHEVGELAPVLAAVAAVADGPSHLRGIAHLRGHETDRLAAIAAELTARGADVREHADWLSIRPRPLHGGIARTYEDHRMATAAAVLGLVVPGVEVERVETVGKTMPGFVSMWRAMLAGTAVGTPVGTPVGTA